LYFSGLNYFEDIDEFNIEANSSIEIERSTWIWVGNDNQFKLNNVSVNMRDSLAQFHMNENYLDGGALVIENGAVMSVIDSEIIFSSNSVDYNGGAIFINNGQLNITNSNVSFINNTADREAIIYGENFSVLNLTGLKLLEARNNESINSNGVLNFGVNDLAISIVNGIERIEATNNRAINGGFLFLQTNAVAINNINRANISHNFAKSGSGGAIYIAGSANLTLEGKDMIFEGNEAYDFGGSVYIENGVLSLISQSGDIIFRQNRDTLGNNDIYMVNGILDLIGTGQGNRVIVEGGIIAYGNSRIKFSGNIDIDGVSDISESDLIVEQSTGNIKGVFKYSVNIEPMKILASSVSFIGGSIDIEDNINGALRIEDSEVHLYDVLITNNDLGSALAAIDINRANVNIRAIEKNMLIDNYGLDIKLSNGAILELYADRNREIRIKNGVEGEPNVSLIKSGLGRLIIDGNAEIIGGTVEVNGGILNIEADRLTAGNMKIINGATYETYKYGTSPNAARKTIVDTLTIESSTISIGIYFNIANWNADKIEANDTFASNAILKATASGDIASDIIGSSVAFIVSGNINENTFGNGGFALWHRDNNRIGLVEYGLDYQAWDRKLYLVILSTELGHIRSMDLNHNQKQVAMFLNGIDDYSNILAEKIMLGILELQKANVKDNIIRKILEQVSGEFIANILKSAALNKEDAKVMSRIGQEGFIAERKGIWIQANSEHMDRIDVLSEREFVSNVYDGQVGINLKMGDGKLFGLYGGYASKKFKHDRDPAEGTDIGIGLYGGHFDDALNLRWLIGWGQQRYDSKRTINIGDKEYNPEAQIEAYAIKANAEIEIFPFTRRESININPIISVLGTYMANSEIKEKNGDIANLEIEAANYMRLEIKGGIRFQGEVAKTKWRVDAMGAYIALGGDNYTYNVRFKDAKEYGAMKIKAGYEPQVYFNTTFILEKEMNPNISVYARTGLDIYPEETKLAGYNAGIGLHVKIGQIGDFYKQSEDRRQIKEAKEAEIQAKLEAEQQSRLQKEIDDEETRQAEAMLADSEAEAKRIAEEIEKSNRAKLIEQIRIKEQELKEEQLEENLKEEEEVVEQSDEDMISAAHNRRKNLIKSYRLSAATFKTGSAELTPAAKEDIRKLAMAIEEYDYHKITVEGHTDSIGTLDRNRELSRDRAKAVYDVLVEYGIDKNKLQHIGFASLLPLESNTSPKGRSANRRVEIFLE
jgi:outer membrane protein OmpA-like peptidoglycan-associated protein